jgi:hypothetical protein
VIDRVHSHGSTLVHAIRVARIGSRNDAQTLRRPATRFAQRLDTASGKKVGRAALAAATDSDSDARRDPAAPTASKCTLGDAAVAGRDRGAPTERRKALRRVLAHNACRRVRQMLERHSRQSSIMVLCSRRQGAAQRAVRVGLRP